MEVLSVMREVWSRIDDCINNCSKSRESCHWHLSYFGHEIYYNVSSKCGFLIPQVMVKLITGAEGSPPKSGDTVNKSWTSICLRSIPSSLMMSIFLKKEYSFPWPILLMYFVVYQWTLVGFSLIWLYSFLKICCKYILFVSMLHLLGNDLLC